MSDPAAARAPLTPETTDNSGDPPEEGAGGNGQGAGNMPDYDAIDQADPADIAAKTAGIKVDFDRQDVEFFFVQLENELESAGVLSQWRKRIVLVRQLPQDIQQELRDLLCKPRATILTTAYIDLKTRLIQMYGRKPGHGFREARKMVLVGKPSQLAKKLINTLCPSHPTLENCCSAGTVSELWRDQLPPEVRNAVANHSLEGGKLEDTLTLADSVFDSSMGNVKKVAAVAIDDPPTEEEIAAIRKARQAKAKPSAKPKTNPNANARRHPDNPPEGSCWAHWKFGKSAISCKAPKSCPWKDHVKKKDESE